jgi:hypothetical protein
MDGLFRDLGLHVGVGNDEVGIQLLDGFKVRLGMWTHAAWSLPPAGASKIRRRRRRGPARPSDRAIRLLRPKGR